MGAYLPTHPGEPVLSLGLSINPNHQVISFHTLSRCKRVQLGSPSHTRRQLPFWVDAGLAAASPLPPIPSEVRNPYFIHNGKERAERCGLGSKWPLFVLGKEDSSYHPPFHPLQEEVPQSPSPTSVCGRSQLLDISSKNTTVNVCKHPCANTHRPLLDHLALSKYNPRK